MIDNFLKHMGFLGPVYGDHWHPSPWLGVVLGLSLLILILLFHIRYRLRYAKALEESESRYRTVIESQVELICRHDPEGTLSFVNEAYCRFFGRSREELIGNCVLTMVAAADRTRLAEHFAGLGPEGSVATFQHQAVAADGVTHWLQWSHRAIVDKQGRVLEIQGVARDICSQVDVEATLRDSEQFLLSILAAAPIGIGVTRNRVLSWTSDNLLKMFGYEPGELLGKSARILYESDSEYERAGLVKYQDIAVHGIGSVETRWVKKDGQVVDILLSSSLIDPTEPSAGTTFTAMDISASKQTEAALQKALAQAHGARDQIEVILRSVADGLVFTDRDNRIVLMSDSAEVMFDKKLSEVFFKPISAMLDNRLLAGQLNRITRGGLVEVMTEIDLGGRRAAERRTLQAKSAVVTGHGGAAVGVITLLRDVTRERTLDRLKTEFISTAAHELRTPLTAVMGFSELLLNSPNFSLEEQREFLGIIHRKSEVLGKIVDDMVDLARLDSGQMIRIDKAAADIGKLLRRCVSDYRKLCAEHRFKYIGPDRPVLLKVDDRKICQAIENLLNNAVGFSVEGSLIEVECKPGPLAVLVAVQDQGVGMTAEQAERAFDKFYRVDASNTAGKGLGLGLSIVKSIVEAHHGKVHLETAAGKGTRVVITLPLSEAGFQAPSPSLVAKTT